MNRLNSESRHTAFACCLGLCNHEQCSSSRANGYFPSIPARSIWTEFSELLAHHSVRVNAQTVTGNGLAFMVRRPLGQPLGAAHGQLLILRCLSHLQLQKILPLVLSSLGTSVATGGL